MKFVVRFGFKFTFKLLVAMWHLQVRPLWDVSSSVIRKTAYLTGQLWGWCGYMAWKLNWKILTDKSIKEGKISSIKHDR